MKTKFKNKKGRIVLLGPIAPFATPILSQILRGGIQKIRSFFFWLVKRKEENGWMIIKDYQFTK